jgi:hypothetical protein
MAVKAESISETLTDDQKELIALYEKQIDDNIVRFYVEGKELGVEPKPYPNYNWKQERQAIGCDEKVVNQILKKYRSAGWSIEWKFRDTGAINTNWVFILKKINDFSDFKGKSLKISLTTKNPNGDERHFSLIAPILSMCKSNFPELNLEYFIFCVPSNFYITPYETIKFVKYKIKEKSWEVCYGLENNTFATDFETAGLPENVNVEII